MLLGSKFVYVSSGDEEEDIVTGNVSSEEEDDQNDDGEVCAVFICNFVSWKQKQDKACIDFVTDVSN